MKIGIMFDHTGKGPDSPALNESLLRSEIAFWRDMIETQNLAGQSHEALERMHQALALAEYRLAGLAGKNPSH